MSKKIHQFNSPELSFKNGKTLQKLMPLHHQEQ